MRTHRGAQAHTDAYGSWSPSLGVWASSVAVGRPGAEKSPRVATRAFRVVTVHSRVARAPIALRRGSSPTLAPSPHHPRVGPRLRPGASREPFLVWGSGSGPSPRPLSLQPAEPQAWGQLEARAPLVLAARGWWWGGGAVPSPRTGNGRKLEPAREGVNF